MHQLSLTFTIGGTVLKEPDDLVILRVTFDSKIIFEKHLRSVSRAASQILGILTNSWRVCYDRLLLRRCCRGLVLPGFCPARFCPARLRIRTLNYWTVQSVVSVFYLGLCLSVTLRIVYL